MWDAITQWDVSVLHWILDHVHNAFLDALMPIITLFGDGGIFWIAVALALMIFRKTRKMGFSMGLALLIGVILGNGVLKNVVGRIRPYDYDPTLVSILKRLPSDLSFPSGHTLASFEAATAIFIRNKKWGVPALVLAVLIALSRLYVTVHYPTDVIAGLLLGVLFAIVACRVIDLLYKKFEKPAEETK